MKKPNVTMTKMKRGRRSGKIYSFPDGRECYITTRRLQEVFRSGEKTISDAVRNSTAFWVLDMATLLDLRVRGVKYVCIHVKENGDRYITYLDKFFNYELTKSIKDNKALSFEHFICANGKVKV